jgi:hypothetical protein
MSYGFGPGDGFRDQSHAYALTETQVAEARRTADLARGPGRWPDGRTLAWIIVLAIVAIVGGGWVLTFLNASR